MTVSPLLGALDPQAKALYGLALLVLLLLVWLVIFSVNYWAKRKYLPRDGEKDKKTDTPDPWTESAKRIKTDDEA